MIAFMEPRQLIASPQGVEVRDRMAFEQFYHTFRYLCMYGLLSRL
jgi:hypothetical protein